MRRAGVVLGTMLFATGYTIRSAGEADEPTLAWLAQLASKPPIARPALICDVDGIPAAALSLDDGRVVADPFRPEAGLAAHLHIHRSGWRARGGKAAAVARVRAAFPLV